MAALARPASRALTTRARAAAAYGFLKRDFLVYVSYRARFFAQLFQIVVSVVLFYYVSRLVSVSSFESPDAYFAYVVVGLVILEVLTATLLYLPLTVRQELVAGTLERLVLSPFGTVGAIVSLSLFPFLMAVILSTATIAIASAVFGLSIDFPRALLGFPVAALGALAFAPFALAIAGLQLVFKQIGSASGFLITLVTLFAGTFFPVSLLPGWIEWVSHVQPFTPAVDLMRHVMVGTEPAGSVGGSLLKLVLFAVVLLPAGMWLLGRAIDWSRARGTIIEY